jgi:hypothetical protein
MLKIKTTKMDPKTNFHVFFKEVYASVCFLEAKIPLIPSRHAAEIFCEKFVYLVLG